MNWTTRDLKRINELNKNTLVEHLGIEFTELNDDELIATMPVNQHTHQPMGLLHGGANAVLIESIGSMASALLIDLKEESPVGLEINANHIGSVRSGVVRGVGKAIHIGKRTHVWQVDVFDGTKLICTGRLTVMILNKNA